MGKPESTGPVRQAEARGQHMSDHPGRLQRGPTSPQPHHRAGREERRRAEEAGVGPAFSVKAFCGAALGFVAAPLLHLWDRVWDRKLSATGCHAATQRTIAAKKR